MNTKGLEGVATSIRTLSMDAIQKANSGHPGMPLGCAELGALLYGEILRHYPEDSTWPNRDRFVLSAGHGSMLLYALLHLSGYDLSLDDIKAFRQVGSRTPGHPEYGHTDGVETTTGPLGQGVGNAVGLAVAEAMTAAKFNTPEHTIVDHYTYALAGDGCMMEGVASEAASMAGHMGLGKLIVFYDSNDITIEGSTEITFSEDVAARFAAYGWQTLSGDAYDFAGMLKLVEEAKADKNRPSLITLKSTIGKGSPTKEGSHETHGAPLGAEEIRAAKKAMGVPEDAEFFVHPDALSYFTAKKEDWRQAYQEWTRTFQAWTEANPELQAQWDLWRSAKPSLDSLVLPEFSLGDSVATRSASGKTLVAAAAALPNLVGGSADLGPSNNTAMPGLGVFGPDTPTGRAFHFGVREHAMGAVCNGMALYGSLRPFCATFLVFSDYMKPAIRLAALMKLPVIYVFTHDSIFVGEDGPTHQPIEHLAALRVIPDLLVLRPGDAQETAKAWEMALARHDGPTALILTRQNLPVYPKADPNWKENFRRGAYIVKDSAQAADTVILATGSEVSLAVQAAEEGGGQVRVVSMPSRELFLAQDKAFQEEVLPPGIRCIVAEVGVSLGWEGFVRDRKDLFTIDSFGLSGPGSQVASALGRDKEALKKLIQD